MKFKKTTLKNGLRIITVPMAGTQTATILLMVGVGARHESEKEAGVSHFIEHMLFKGTQKRPDARAISEELDAIGGEFNAFTSKERTGYHAKVDAQHFTTAVDVICDIFLNSKIEDVEIKKERGSIIQELEMYEDRPSQKVWDVFYQLLYGKNSLGRDIIGYKKTLKTFTRQDLIAYMQKHYVAKETVICLAGKFNEKQVLKQIQNSFAKFTPGAKNIFEKVVEKQNAPAVKAHFKKTDQTSVLIGNRAYDKNHPDRHALALLSVILGGNMSSRLFAEIREKRGLAYSVYTNVETHHDSGYLVAKMGVAHKNLALATEVVLEQFEKMKTELVGEQELQRAKDYLKGKAVMDLEASDEVAQFFGEQELVKGKIMTLEELFAKLEKVKAADIRRVAQNVFRKETLNLAVVGPHKETALKKMLSEIVLKK
jgi:predicted Zn-dependent peptidase